jgi:hypothetical protein
MKIKSSFEEESVAATGMTVHEPSSHKSHGRCRNNPTVKTWHRPPMLASLVPWCDGQSQPNAGVDGMSIWSSVVTRCTASDAVGFEPRARQLADSQGAMR